MGIYNRLIIFLFLVSWILPSLAWADHCTVAKIAIIAGTWENTDTSTSYTVQSQDSNGESCHVSQTLRLSFESTEGGNFTGQTGSPVQAWISSNSANRNFYYLHSLDEDYVLTIKAGYGAADSWETLFTTSYSTSDASDEDTSTASTTSEVTTNTSSSQSSSNTVSPHYSATPISNLKTTLEFEVSAGRDRLGTVGSPLEFKAETNYGYTRNSIFKWNFGDGSERVGDVLSHTYEYPGEYVVVLNVSLPGGQAVARVNVKIVKPEIAITLAMPERIEIRNNSKYEVSLFGRALVSGGQIFAFPQDTIIKAGQSVAFSVNLTGLRPNGLDNVGVWVVGESRGQGNLMAKVEEQRLKQIASVESQISTLQKRLADVSNKQNRASSTRVVINMPAGTSTVGEGVVESENNESQTALVIEAVTPEASPSIIGNWLKTLKRFFLRTRE